MVAVCFLVRKVIFLVGGPQKGNNWCNHMHSKKSYDLQHACSQSITNVISICRHQFCCNNTKGGSRRRQSCCSYPFSGQHRPNHAEMVFVSGFPLREDFDANLNYLFPYIFIFRWNQYFSTFFSNRTAKRLAPSCAKSGKSPMKANNLLLVDHSRVHIEKKLAFQIILAISSIYYLWALHSDYLHVICAKCEKISYKM